MAIKFRLNYFIKFLLDNRTSIDYNMFMTTSFAINYNNYFLTIAKNGEEVFSKDFYNDAYNDRIQGVYDALFEYTDIPEEHLEKTLEEVTNFGYAYIDLYS